MKKVKLNQKRKNEGMDDREIVEVLVIDNRADAMSVNEATAVNV